MDPTTLDPTLVQQAIALVQSIPYAGKVLVYIPPLITVAAIMDAAFPVPPAGSIWVWPRRVIHFLAVNFGSARNAIPAGTVPASVAVKAAEASEAIRTLGAATGELMQSVAGQPEAAKVPVSAVGDRATP